MGILSIQSHVVYGYVGNKAAVYPLQSMGYDVWPVNTVQFSSHTGYDNWRGDVFSREHIRSLIGALEVIGVSSQCQAIISGYMGSRDICMEVMETVERFKAKNNQIIYLCDPVMGNNNCFVKPEVVEFFKMGLRADIVTPNQFEAEILAGVKIESVNDLKKIAEYFHSRDIKIVVVTGIKKLKITDSNLDVFVSDGVNQYIIGVKEYNFKIPVNGTGDLFSAVFLGNFLASKNALTAAKNAVYYMDLVVKNTFAINSSELQVVSTRYDAINSKENEITAIAI